jgi:dihydroflavonol-4-reductase
MKAFVTGGTGFIGSHLIRKLQDRGYEVHALVRSQAAAAVLEAIGVQPVWGDISSQEAMRPGMQGCDVVFHLAGWYKVGAQDQSMAWRINVDGTRNVLSLAFELGIPRILYTSTVAVFGDTKGKLVDESYQMPDRNFISEYDHTKWAAHYEVAQPLIKQGAPIIILQPGIVYGPGDHSLVGQMMQAFYRGWLVFFPGPETLLSFAHVEDIAEGHLLAAEKGQPGESYIITGPSLSLRSMVHMWAKVSGKPAPLAYIPARWIKPLLPLAEFLNRYLPMPEILSPDGVRILGVSYAARAYKAWTHLGWETRPLERGMQETFDWIAQEARLKRTPGAVRKRRAAILALGAGLGLLILWISSGRRKRS